MLNWDLKITKKYFENSERKIVVAMNAYQNTSIIPIYISYVCENIFKIPSGIIFFETNVSETDEDILNYHKISEIFLKNYNIDKNGYYYIQNNKIINFKSTLTLNEINDFILTI